MLAETSNLMTGDPYLCDQCGACISVFSNLQRTSANTFNWVCDFCEKKHTNISLEEAEIPKTENLDCICVYHIFLCYFDTRGYAVPTASSE